MSRAWVTPIVVSVLLGFIAGVAATVLGPYEPVEVMQRDGITCKTHQPEAWLVCRDDRNWEAGWYPEFMGPKVPTPPAPSREPSSGR
jgi:hypothetical protein